MDQVATRTKARRAEINCVSNNEPTDVSQEHTYDELLAFYKSKGAGKGGTGKFNGDCYNCGRKGHRAKDCWDSPNKGKGAQKGQTNGAPGGKIGKRAQIGAKMVGSMGQTSGTTPKVRARAHLLIKFWLISLVVVQWRTTTNRPTGLGLRACGWDWGWIGTIVMH